MDGRWQDRVAAGGYVDAPDGWWPLLERLGDRLEELWPDWRVLQAKEKLGSLRVYLDVAPPEVADAVARAVAGAERAAAAAPVGVCGHPRCR